MVEQHNQQDPMRPLIDRAKTGDRGAFEELYRAYLTPIYRFIYWRVGGDQSIAEDLTQTVFLKVWQALPGYEERGKPMLAWLYRIARNAVIDWRRREKSVGIEASEEYLAKLPEDRRGPEAELAGRETAAAVLEAIKQLSDDQQEAIVFKFLQELSNKEIAELTGKTEMAIRQLQSRAIKQLRKYLDINETD